MAGAPVATGAPIVLSLVPPPDEVAQEIDLTLGIDSDGRPSIEPLNGTNSEARNVNNEHLEEIFGGPKNPTNTILTILAL